MQLLWVGEIISHCYSLMISYFAEINKVRVTLFNLEKKPLSLPDEEGPKITLTEKLFVPVKEHPDVSVPHMLSEALKCEIGFVVYLPLGLRDLLDSNVLSCAHEPQWIMFLQSFNMTSCQFSKYEKPKVDSITALTLDPFKFLMVQLSKTTKPHSSTCYSYEHSRHSTAYECCRKIYCLTGGIFSLLIPAVE